jgi:hypothetical protein
MPADITASELELMTFFECAPAQLDRDVPWPYDCFTYEFHSPTESLKFEIHPAMPTVELSVVKDGETVFTLSADTPLDVRVHLDAERETLELKLSEKHKIFITKLPRIVIREQFNNAN